MRLEVEERSGEDYSYVLLGFVSIDQAGFPDVSDRQIRTDKLQVHTDPGLC